MHPAVARVDRLLPAVHTDKTARPANQTACSCQLSEQLSLRGMYHCAIGTVADHAVQYARQARLPQQQLNRVLPGCRDRLQWVVRGSESRHVLPWRRLTDPYTFASACCTSYNYVFDAKKKFGEEN
jgi:hypothetical protein